MSVCISHSMMYPNNGVSRGGRWDLFSAGHNIETTLRRFIQRIGRIAGKTPFEAFIPVQTRNPLVLSTGNFIFVRSPNLTVLAHLASITGVTGMQTWGDSGKVKDALRIEDAEVQLLIAEDRRRFETAGARIREGSFVRISDGDARDYAGTVTRVNKIDHFATIKVELKTKVLWVRTPVRNLEDLSHVPSERRVFYYCPLVEELEDVSLLAEDLHFRVVPKPAFAQETNPYHHVRWHLRDTLSVALRGYIAQDMTPAGILRVIVSRLRNKDFPRMPKQCISLSCILKLEMRRAGIKVPRNMFAPTKLHRLLPDIPLNNRR